MKVTKAICKVLMDKKQWKPIHCTFCTMRKKCDHLDYQEQHEGSVSYAYKVEEDERKHPDDPA